jgi:hypothetical protein
MAIADVFECVALSCDIEPRFFTDFGRDRLLKPTYISDATPPMGTNPWEETDDPRAANNAAESLLYARFCAAAGSVSEDGPLRPDSTIRHNSADAVRIKLADFVRWAISAQWWLPEALTAIANRKLTAATSRAADWIATARHFADECYRHDLRLTGRPPFKTEIAKDVARKLAEQGVRGSRGDVIDRETVRRHGLKGWTPPKG